MTGPGWYGIRTIFRFDGVAASGDAIFEERVCVYKTSSLDEAFEKAKAEAHEYVDTLSSDEQPCVFLGLFQSYYISEEVESGVEVFSLMRESELGDEEYLSHFFDTGRELHRVTNEE